MKYDRQTVEWTDKAIVAVGPPKDGANDPVGLFISLSVCPTPTQNLWLSVNLHFIPAEFCFNVSVFCSSCFNGATCLDGINSFSCQCPVGFTGAFCLLEINECDSQPCLNKGTCMDSLGTYQCICPLGYTGKDCQVSGIELGLL